MVLFKDFTFEDKVGVRKNLTCCKDCSIKFENEALSISSNLSKKACSSSLPTWLQNCKEERSYIMEDQVSIIIVSHTEFKKISFL
jgi:ATP-dependent Clp protease ATP-binding subunit ClpB